MKPENMTILTVDDTPANIRLLMHYLEKQGYNVITAEDGFEGFKAAIQFKPDLILLDVMMPGTDGYEVCELLKAEEETKDIPVVFLTAKTDAEDKVRGFELGAVDYITKPFKLVEISTRVEKLLQMKYFEKLSRQYQAIIKGMLPASTLGTITGLSGNEQSPAFKQKYAEATAEITSRLEPILLDDIFEAIQFQLNNDQYAMIQVDYEPLRMDAYVRGNPGVWYQIFLNLLLNAVEINDGAAHFVVQPIIETDNDEDNPTILSMKVEIIQADQFEEAIKLSKDESGQLLIDQNAEAAFGLNAAQKAIGMADGVLELNYTINGLHAIITLPI